jgi:hypothetical protein
MIESVKGPELPGLSRSLVLLLNLQQERRLRQPVPRPDGESAPRFARIFENSRNAGSRSGFTQRPVEPPRSVAMPKGPRGARRVVHHLLRQYVDRLQREFATTPEQLWERVQARLAERREPEQATTSPDGAI